MSTPSTDAEGFVMISQARPQNDQEKVSQTQPMFNAPTGMPKPLVTFYRGEPEVLGTVQIFVGILLISFGIMFTILCQTKCHHMQTVVYTGVLIWSGALYIVSGSLSVASSVTPTMVKVKTSLVMNIISIAAAIIAIIMITTVFPSPIYYTVSNFYCAYYKQSTECIGAFNPRACLAGVYIFLCLLSVLMFCITISTSVFGCRTVCRSSYHEMNVIIYQSTSLHAPDTTTEVPPQSTTTQDS